MKIIDFITKKRQLNDHELVAGCKNHVKSVEKELYARCRELFDSIKYKYVHFDYDDKQEIFQKAFITMWEKIEYGDLYVENGNVMVKKKGGTANVSNLISFFIGIVNKKYMEDIRARGKEIPSDLRMADEVDEPFDEDPKTHLMRIVDHAIKQMPKHCSEIINMFYVDGMTLEEILAKRPESSSYNGLKNGKAKCMTKLKKFINETAA